jgi:hypothetical protein
MGVLEGLEPLEPPPLAAVVPLPSLGVPDAVLEG